GEGNVVFSYEESYGYMAGDYVRDKDAVTAAVLITAMTAHYLARGRTLLHVLEELYAKLGHYGEETVSLIMPGIDGLRDMRALMAALRDTPPGEIAGTAVVSRRDYLPGIEYGADGERELRLRGSDVLCFHLDDGTEIFIRPSGTEPKIKIYVLAKGADAAECSEKTRKYAAWAAALSEPKPG
ncbi:MAG: phospho-sugar mutase, partial [Oscillospiraceae bacterium]|nr:phospho-sugar mutase [Oscillospiraceae bacterium]